MADSDENIPANSSSSASKSGPWNLIAIVAIVTIIAIMLVPGEEEEPIEDLPPLNTQQQSLLPEDDQSAQTAATEQDSAAKKTPAGPLAPGAAARQLIAQLRSQTPLDLEKAYAAAQEHQAAGRLDDAYLLYFFAAREGHGDAAMALGKQVDPAHFAETGLFDRPDEIQAHKWYTLAKQAGVEQAQASLSSLHQRVESAASGGDDRARRIMLQWK